MAKYLTLRFILKEFTMKTLQVLGTGCARCRKLTEQAEAAAKALGIEYRIEKIDDLQEIMKFGVMTTPALVVDGRVKVAGKVPSVDEIKQLLRLTTFQMSRIRINCRASGDCFVIEQHGPRSTFATDREQQIGSNRK